MKLARTRQIALPLLAAALLLAGCAAPTPGPLPTGVGVTATLEIATSEAATTQAGASATARARPTATPTAPVRSAALHELVNLVEARPDEAAAFATASEGQAVGEAGEVRTGDASKARLDFSDGAIVRLAPNTLFVVAGLAGTDDNPLTRLQFALGKIWVSLFSGQFEAETPVGVATVRGSYAEFQYDPGPDPNSTLDDVLTIKCIEGICTYSDGSRTITLGNLEQVIISDGGQTIAGPTPLPPGAVEDFLANSPESTAVVLTLTAAAPSPTASRTPTATARPSDTPVPPNTRRPPTVTPSATNTETPTPAPTDTATNPPPPPPPSNTPVPSDTPIPSDTLTPTPNYTPTRTPGPTKTPSPTNTP